MHQDITNLVKTFERYKKAKGPYNDPNVKQGPLIAYNTVDLLGLDFTKMDPRRDAKENILMIMDAFSNFTVAVVTTISRKRQWPKSW